MNMYIVKRLQSRAVERIREHTSLVAVEHCDYVIVNELEDYVEIRSCNRGLFDL
jgi:hypothetical protein